MSRANLARVQFAGNGAQEVLSDQLEALKAMRVSELQDTFYDVYGRATAVRNRDWLIKRVFYRVQELVTKRTLSERARARIRELGKDQDIRARPSKGFALPKGRPSRDPRLPPVGSVIRRAHQGVVHEIRVLEDGFEYAGRHYVNLSTIAREVTGTNWNGFVWAGLSKRKSRSNEAGGAA